MCAYDCAQLQYKYDHFYSIYRTKMHYNVKLHQICPAAFQLYRLCTYPKIYKNISFNFCADRHTNTHKHRQLVASVLPQNSEQLWFNFEPPTEVITYRCEPEQ